jgi:mRNA interferase MazF
MVDKIVAMPREKCCAVIGRLDDASLIALDHMLSIIIGLVD